MSKQEDTLRELLHKYRKEAMELREEIARTRRIQQERADAQAKAEARQRVAAQSHRDGTKLPVRQGKSSARAHVLFAGQAPGDTATTNVPQLRRVRVTFPKD